MSNKKQTAVENLCEVLARKLGLPNVITFYHDHQEEIKQAKEMEKQQIIDAVDGFPIENRNMLGEEYYQKTYGNI